MNFATRSILITGASDGIGAEIARQLANEKRAAGAGGARAEALERVGAECRELGAEAIVVPTDVTVDDDCRRLVERAVEAYGGIDVLVANAGVSMHARFTRSRTSRPSSDCSGSTRWGRSGACAMPIRF